jgi:hypothetical protein
MPLFDRLPRLLVSLPRNDVALAEAAVAGGADGLKTHINVHHRASGTRFGSVADERAALEPILGLGVPTGLVIGGEGAVHRSEIAAAAAMRFAFFDVYLSHAPAWYVAACGDVPATAALGADEPLQRAAVLADLGFAAVEASLAPADAYRTPLPASRVADYARLARLTSLPVIVPSQHAITADDVPALIAAGIGVLLIGAVVTGDDPDSVHKTTAEFRSALRSARHVSSATTPTRPSRP